MGELDDYRDKVLDSGDNIGGVVFNAAIDFRKKMIDRGMSRDTAGNIILQAHMSALASICAAVASELKGESNEEARSGYGGRYDKAMEKITECVQEVLSEYASPGESIVFRVERGGEDGS